MLILQKKVKTLLGTTEWVVKIFILIIFILVGNGLIRSAKLNAQELNRDSIKSFSSGSIHIPKVYIDCRRCDYDFVRIELPFVNYVRDPELADIHVFVTDERTAGGGTEYQFSFIGKHAFSGIQYTINHHIGHDATREETRAALTDFLKLGFASFMLQTPLATRFSVEYDENEDYDTPRRVDDPWDHWVFQAYLGRIEWELESNQSEFDSRWGIFADRVTEKWKFRIRPYFNYERVKIQTTEADEPVTSTQRRHGLDSYAVKSLSSHWSAGIFGTYYTFNGRNIRHQVLFRPGIEYSFLPYRLATRRAITFNYLLGYGYYDYYEETIFNKTKENLLSHQLRGIVNIQQSWGSIETGLIGSQYLHDFNRNRIEFYGHTSIRLFEGFSLRFQAEYEVIRDQLSLPKGEATLEEVLLRQRELATDFNFSTSFAITYTWGSEFSNVVNTRF